MKGKLIVLKGGDTTITENKQAEAMKLLKEGYQFWTLVEQGQERILGRQVKPQEIVEEDDVDYIGMRPLAGG
mgnify:CR=1 FL=1